MTHRRIGTVIVAAFIVAAFLSANGEDVQASKSERTFPQPRAAIEKALKTIQSSVAGRLPSLEGFVRPADHPLDQFQRAYYQSAVRVKSLPSGGSAVQVSATITAWYRDPAGVHSGYQTLASNGRLEADLLDQLSDALGNSAIERKLAPEPGISAPMPRLPEASLRVGPAIPGSSETSGSLKSQTEAEEKREQELLAEAKGLEEILQNQTHPDNLLSIKKTGTPILQSPKEDAKILFAATAGDEFEILDLTASWVHIRISGISRGWVRRSLVEMPESFGASEKSAARAGNGEEQFQVSGEQMAPFPGDWAPLRGKIVKIVTVRRAGSNSHDEGAVEKLRFAKALFLTQYADIEKQDGGPAGVVIIFDAEDGGMMAATSATLKEWEGGAASDQVAWKQCFFDPPELAGTKE